MSLIKTNFENVGAKFLIDFSTFENKLSNIKAFIFDWDGVFNSGEKNSKLTNTFSEIDSMGINILRFGHYILHNKIMPLAIITGENNKTSFVFAEREHIQNIYFKVKDKKKAFFHFIESNNLKPENVAFCFDDILDLSIAKLCGLRFQVKNNASLVFIQFCIDNNFVDYITANSGQNNAIREICELVLTTQDVFDKSVNHRINFDDNYSEYLNLRNNYTTNRYTQEKDKIIKI